MKQTDSQRVRVFLHADARKIANFVRANLWDEERQRLLRSYLNGPSDVEGFADDYAYLISGLLDLYGASGETQWLAFAQQLQQKQDKLFWDGTAGRSKHYSPSSKLNVRIHRISGVSYLHSLQAWVFMMFPVARLCMAAAAKAGRDLLG